MLCLCQVLLVLLLKSHAGSVEAERAVKDDISQEIFLVPWERKVCVKGGAVNL